MRQLSTTTPFGQCLLAVVSFRVLALTYAVNDSYQALAKKKILVIDNFGKCVEILYRTLIAVDSFWLSNANSCR